MAIGVDKVYRTVLSIANKENRGFITPDNIAKIGAQVQLSIMEDNLVEYRKLINQRSAYKHAANYGDLVRLYKEKIDTFLKTTNVTPSSGVITFPTTAYKLLDVYSTNRETKYEEVSRSDLNYKLSSPISSPSADFPIFYKNNNGLTATINPTTESALSVDYLSYPSSPRWGYFDDSSDGRYVFDSNSYISDGLVIRDNTLTNITSNISNGVDGTYTVLATRSDASQISLDVTVSGNIVVSIKTLESSSGFLEGATLVVETVLGAADGTYIPVSGLSGDLVISVQSQDIYNGSTAGSINFELHPSDEVRLVTDILGYYGIVIRDTELAQISGNIAQVKEMLKRQ